jgi:putative PIN family toxin of toxin-antitoxin system
MRLVLDTDVVLSGLQSATGASRLLLCGAAERAFVPLVTTTMLFEYEDVLLRPASLAMTGVDARATIRFLDGLLSVADRVTPRHRVRPSIRDPADEMFVDALVNGGGDAVVTFNRRDYLDPDERRGQAGLTAVPVLSPAEALRRLPWRPTATMPFVSLPP